MNEQKERLFGVPAQVLAGLTGVDRTTATRWKLGRARMPRAARELVAMHLDGALGPRAGATWSGWTWGHDGLLYAPDLKRGFSPTDLYELHWLQQAATWRSARARAAAMDPAYSE